VPFYTSATIAIFLSANLGQTNFAKPDYDAVLLSLISESIRFKGEETESPIESFVEHFYKEMSDLTFFLEF
jgi:hypothetical protein